MHKRESNTVDRLKSRLMQEAVPKDFPESLGVSLVSELRKEIWLHEPLMKAGGVVKVVFSNAQLLPEVSLKQRKRKHKNRKPRMLIFSDQGLNGLSVPQAKSF